MALCTGMYSSSKETSINALQVSLGEGGYIFKWHNVKGIIYMWNNKSEVSQLFGYIGNVFYIDI